MTAAAIVGASPRNKCFYHSPRTTSAYRATDNCHFWITLSSTLLLQQARRIHSTYAATRAETLVNLTSIAAVLVRLSMCACEGELPNAKLFPSAKVFMWNDNRRETTNVMKWNDVKQQSNFMWRMENCYIFTTNTTTGKWIIDCFYFYQLFRLSRESKVKLTV